jgi:hypothetical protein
MGEDNHQDYLKQMRQRLEERRSILAERGIAVSHSEAQSHSEEVPVLSPILYRLVAPPTIREKVGEICPDATFAYTLNTHTRLPFISSRIY